MATDYYLKGKSAAISYAPHGFTVMTEEVDSVDMKTRPLLSDAYGNGVVLPSNGFQGGDKVYLFHVPAGSLVRVASGHITQNNYGNDVYLKDASGTWLQLGTAPQDVITLVSKDYGANNVMGKFYSSDSWIYLSFDDDGPNYELVGTFSLGLMVV